MDGVPRTGSPEWSCLSQSVPSPLLPLPPSVPKPNCSEPRHLGTCVYNVLYICG